MKHHPEFYLIGVFVLLLAVWIIQRKRILSLLKHHGRHQIINIEGKPVSQLAQTSMITMPILTFNYSKFKWDGLNKEVVFNIEDKSGIRLCGRPGSGKSFVFKTIYEQITLVKNLF